MYGIGILKGLGVTLKHFVVTYLEDMRGWIRHYSREETIARRQSWQAKGIFTIEYPEEKLTTPEEFRFLPFLVYEEGPQGERKVRCTSCGICSKVCPPQCIWITRSSDPVTGRPIPEPKEFSIDIDVCMNCGLCAEFCPFDAIKMDHDFELASYDRVAGHIYDKERLLKPASYYRAIRPLNCHREEVARAEKEAAKTSRK
jgi:NADH-quinone oxidoreductase subunit I